MKPPGQVHYFQAGRFSHWGNPMGNPMGEPEQLLRTVRGELKAGLEPATYGLQDHCAANCATLACTGGWRRFLHNNPYHLAGGNLPMTYHHSSVFPQAHLKINTVLNTVSSW